MHRAKELAFICGMALCHKRLTAPPPAVQTSGTLPHMWEPDVGFHRRLMAFVKLHHDNHICPIKAVSNQWGWIFAPQEFFLKTNGHFDRQI
jgi:hypothetical protein